MRKIRFRQRTFETTHQICWSAPGPSISHIRRFSPGAIWIEGETFQPRPVPSFPSPRAWIAPVPLSAIPPLPFSPVKFSALIERVLADDNRHKLPRCMPRPVKVSNTFPPVQNQQDRTRRKKIELVLLSQRQLRKKTRIQESGVAGVTE